MLSGTGARRASAAAGLTGRRQGLPRRQLSTVTVRPGNLNRLRPTLPARNPSAALAPPSVRAFSIWGWNITGGRGNKSEPAPAEKAETSSTTSTPPASETTSTTTGTVSTPDGAAAAATPAPDAPAEAVSSGAEAIDAVAPNLAAELAEIPETFGYLKALGLDYGWGPSTLVEYLLESIHLYTGLPWWASVVTAAVAIRAVLFKATLGASDTAAKMNEIKPRITPLNQRMLALYQAGDTAGSLALRKEVQQIQHEHGLKPWKAMLPLIQVPIGFGCFRVMRGMSSLPVPGLESEHLLWLTDVSVNDPYFILPVLTGTMMYFSIKRGGETGTSNLNATAMGRAMLVGLPITTTAFMSFWPSLLQLYFGTTGLWSLGQTYALQSPAFRRAVKVAPLPVRTAPTTAVPEEPKLRMYTPPVHYRPPQPATPDNDPVTAEPAGYINRLVAKTKRDLRQSVKEANDKLAKLQGDASDATNADGSPAAPPRLSRQEREKAEAHEERRRQEDELDREMLNRQRRAAYLASKKRAGKGGPGGEGE